LEGCGRNFEDAFKWKIDNGEEISLREDSWAGCGALKSVYPRLFSLSSFKVVEVVELEVWTNGV